MTEKLEIFSDGACSGNPGPAGVGVVIRRDGKTIKQLRLSIGEATNNIAEYVAAIFAIQEALFLHAQKVALFTDSELFANQFNGSFKVKNPNIRPLFYIVKHLESGFESLEVKHVLRGKNQEADKLAKEAIKEQAKMVASQNSSEKQLDFSKMFAAGRKVRAPKDNASC